jgi:hypothetical protein
VPATAATIEPFAFVLRRDEAIEEIAKAVVVAFVVVEFPVMTRFELMVEDAETKMPRVVVGRREVPTTFQSLN